MKAIMCDRCGRAYGYGIGGFVLIVDDPYNDDELSMGF